jgi:hypothetical protein
MHSALHACHSLMVHFAMFAGSNIEAFDPIIELEWAKCKMGGPERGKGRQSGRRLWAIGGWKVGITLWPLTCVQDIDVPPLCPEKVTMLL